VPGTHITIPYISQADREDIIFAIQNGFDFIAASFVRMRKIFIKFDPY
jgi:pyruvate kinase